MVWSPGLIYKEFNTVEITNTTTKTEIYSMTVPGGFVDESNILQININNVFSNGTGVTQYVLPYLEYITSSGTISQGLASQEIVTGTQGTRMVVDVWPKNSTSCMSTFKHELSNTGVSSTNPVEGNYLHYQDLNVDFSENITIKLSVVLSTASASLSFYKKNAHSILL